MAPNRKRTFFAGAAVGLAIAVTAAAATGVHFAGAEAQTRSQARNEGTQVSPLSVPAPVAPGAPATFADIVQRVAPAVVSIDVSVKARPRNVGFSQGQFGQGQGLPFSMPFQIPGFGDDDEDDGDTPARPRGRAQPTPRAAPMQQATGSGFFISGDGYIVTNNHVVEDAQEITVRMTDQRELKARLIGRDPATDLAVIKVEGGNFPYVSFEDKAKPRVGDWVIAVGNPFNLGGTATAGIVSALSRENISGSSYVDYIQIDAPINRGNSGGPTFDVYGRVVGVNSAIFSPSGGSVGIGFDIPADVAQTITRQLIGSGKVTRGYIGATVQPLTADLAQGLGVPQHSGALVADLTPGGPSERAGLRSGDLVQEINGSPVASGADLTRKVALVRPGETLHLVVLRDGRKQAIDVRAGQRPAEDQIAANDRNDGPER